MIGHTVGRYRIPGRLGGGSMVEVRVANLTLGPSPFYVSAVPS